MFAPVHTITPAIAKALMSIEADRQAVAGLPIDVTVLAKLRETAKLVSTHYSTQIEGNRLTQGQVKEAVAGARIPGKERDVMMAMAGLRGCWRISFCTRPAMA